MNVPERPVLGEYREEEGDSTTPHLRHKRQRGAVTTRRRSRRFGFTARLRRDVLLPGRLKGGETVESSERCPPAGSLDAGPVCRYPLREPVAADCGAAVPVSSEGGRAQFTLSRRRRSRRGRRGRIRSRGCGLTQNGRHPESQAMRT